MKVKTPPKYKPEKTYKLTAYLQGDKLEKLLSKIANREIVQIDFSKTDKYFFEEVKE